MKINASVFLFMLSAATSGIAQPISIGGLGGVPLIDQTDAHGNPLNHDESRPYVVGPSVEVRLPAGFALEADALYQRVGSTTGFQLLEASIPAGSTGSPTIPTITAMNVRSRANEWEFPLLAKYYFRRDSQWQPFVGTGWAMRFGSFNQFQSQTIVNGNVSNTASFRDSFRSNLEVGATFAAGVRYRMGRFALLPQVRYTRWGASNNVLRRNEAMFLLGLSF